MKEKPPDQQQNNAPGQSEEEPGRTPQGNLSPNTAEQPSRPYVSNPLQVFLDSLKRLFTVNFATFLRFAGVMLLTIIVVSGAILSAGLRTVSNTGNTTNGNISDIITINNITGNLGELAWAAIGVVVVLAWGVILQAAWKTYVIETARESRISLGKAFSSGVRKAPGLLGVNILFFGGFLIGLGLLIVPGLLFLYWFVFARHVYIDTDASILQSFRESKKLTQGKLRELVGLASATLVLGLPGAHSGFGTFYQILFIPVNSLAWAYRYTSADMLQRTETPKPETHVANLVLPCVIVASVVLITLALAVFTPSWY
ncbi:hypothetical protein BRC19_01585 [Candidatus Saccharibacteria bacterium QS_5_54_17]|nr:MAG: hypothetical protein BRC19_01585 [Candidatus Saccharibacteria bacterium QS_5_54_17]